MSEYFLGFLPSSIDLELDFVGQVCSCWPSFVVVCLTNNNTFETFEVETYDIQRSMEEEKKQLQKSKHFRK